MAEFDDNSIIIQDGIDGIEEDVEVIGYADEDIVEDGSELVTGGMGIDGQDVFVMDLGDDDASYLDDGIEAVEPSDDSIF